MPLKLAPYRPQQLAPAIGGVILLASGTLLGSTAAIAQVITDAERNALPLPPEIPAALTKAPASKAADYNLNNDKALAPLQPVIPATMQPGNTSPAKPPTEPTRIANEEPALPAPVKVAEPVVVKTSPLPDLPAKESPVVPPSVAPEKPPREVAAEAPSAQPEPTQVRAPTRPVMAPEPVTAVAADAIKPAQAPAAEEPADTAMPPLPPQRVAAKPKIDLSADKRLGALEPEIPAGLQKPAPTAPSKTVATATVAPATVVSAPPAAVAPAPAPRAEAAAPPAPPLASVRAEAPVKAPRPAAPAAGLRVYYASGNTELSAREKRAVEYFCAKAGSKPGRIVEVFVSIPSVEAARTVALRQNALRSLFSSQGINGEQLRFRATPYAADAPGSPGAPLAPHYAEFRLIESL